MDISSHQNGAVPEKKEGDAIFCANPRNTVVSLTAKSILLQVSDSLTEGKCLAALSGRVEVLEGGKAPDPQEGLEGLAIQQAKQKSQGYESVLLGQGIGGGNPIVNRVYDEISLRPRREDLIGIVRAMNEDLDEKDLNCAFAWSGMEVFLLGRLSEFDEQITKLALDLRQDDGEKNFKKIAQEIKEDEESVINCVCSDVGMYALLLRCPLDVIVG